MLNHIWTNTGVVSLPQRISCHNGPLSEQFKYIIQSVQEVNWKYRKTLITHFSTYKSLQAYYRRLVLHFYIIKDLLFPQIHAFCFFCLRCLYEAVSCCLVLSEPLQHESTQVIIELQFTYEVKGWKVQTLNRQTIKQIQFDRFQTD